MLRVTPQTAVDGIERFRLDGQLAGAYVAELDRALQPSLQASRDVALDLQGLTFVDAEGADLLKALASRNVEIHGCSDFVAQLLALPVRRSAAPAAWDAVVEMLAARHTAAAMAGADDEDDRHARVRAVDEAADERLVRACVRRLLVTARRLLGRETEARQVVEETLKAALRSSGARGELPRPIALTRGVVARALHTLRREVERAGPPPETLLPRFDRTGHHAAMIADWATPEPVQALDGHLADRVRSVLSGLPPPHRAVFLLSDVEGLSPEQVAAILPLTRRQVKARRHQARQMLREALTPIFGAAPQAEPLPDHRSC